jgi:hypothetical protein
MSVVTGGRTPGLAGMTPAWKGSDRAAEDPQEQTGGWRIPMTRAAGSHWAKRKALGFRRWDPVVWKVATGLVVAGTRRFEKANRGDTKPEGVGPRPCDPFRSLTAESC